MEHVLRLWYVQSAPWALARYMQTVHVLDGTFAVADTWRNIGRPLFQDYTWQGRAIGVVLRILRIFAGGITYLLAGFVFLAVYLFWLAFPVLCIIILVGGFLGPSFIPPTT